MLLYKLNFNIAISTPYQMGLSIIAQGQEGEGGEGLLVKYLCSESTQIFSGTFLTFQIASSGSCFMDSAVPHQRKSNLQNNKRNSPRRAILSKLYMPTVRLTLTGDFSKLPRQNTFICYQRTAYVCLYVWLRLYIDDQNFVFMLNSWF